MTIYLKELPESEVLNYSYLPTGDDYWTNQYNIPHIAEKQSWQEFLHEHRKWILPV